MTRPDPKAIAGALRLILEPGQVTELRAIEAVVPGDRRTQTVSGYFDDVDRLAQAAASIITAKGIYLIVNPINPALLARAENRIRPAGKEPLTSDADIISRRWLLIDCDPVRPAGISASDEEHQAALERAEAICEELVSRGWPEPILADSGNGAHLLYRVDLPADDGGLIQRCLETLAARFDDAAVKIDRTVSNASRIWKLYGTMACKGDSTSERPHRMARIREAPKSIETVGRELLEALTADAPDPAVNYQTTTSLRRDAINESPESLRAYLESRGVTVKAVKPRRDGGHVLVLDGCPMNGDHGKGTDTAAVLLSNGTIGFECKHNGCVGYKWSDLRSKIDPAFHRQTTSKPAAEPVKPKRPTPRVDQHRPFPVKELPGRLREFVKAISAATGTPPAYASLATLVVAAGCVGNRAAVRVKRGWVEPCVLWGVLIGRSGTTKTPLLTLAIQAIQEMYKVDRAIYVEAMREHAKAFEHYAVALAAWKQAQKKGPPTDPPVEPEPPREKRLVVSDITMEKLGCLLENNPLGLLLVRDELAAWVGAFDRYAPGGKGSDRPAWLSMHSAALVSIDRKSGTGTVFVERAAVSVLGGMQPGTLRRVFGMAEREAGLLARALLVYPPDTPSLWTEAELSEDAAQSWSELLQALLDLKPAEDEAGNTRPRLIPLSPEAKVLWVEWHNAHARELADIDNDDLAAHFAKLKGICARLALLFTCIEVASGGFRADSIGAVQMQQAINVTEWFKREARRVYAILGESDDDRDRRRLVELIGRKGGELTVRELQRASRVYPTAEDAEAVLEDLVKAGYGGWTDKGPTPKGGRPARVFRLIEAPTGQNLEKTKESEGSVSVGAVGAPVDDAPWLEDVPPTDDNPPLPDEGWEPEPGAPEMEDVNGRIDAENTDSRDD